MTITPQPPTPDPPPDRMERKYYDSGTLKEEIPYLGLSPHGMWREWWPNGQVKAEWPMIRGVYENGACRQWYENGTLASESIYKNGQVLQTRVYDVRGTLIYDSSITERNVIHRFITRAKKAKPRTAKSHAARAAEIDAFATRMLEKSALEALAWLKPHGPNSERPLGELDHHTALELIEGLYQLGARDVHVVDIQSDDMTAVQSANDLVIRLPDSVSDAQARTRVLTLIRLWARHQGFDPEPDAGQTLAYLRLC
jgi:hypothetical protein